MQPKSLEEEEADSAKKIQRRQARANKQKPLQTPSPQQQRFCMSRFFVADTQPRLDLVSNVLWWSVFVSDSCIVTSILKPSHVLIRAVNDYENLWWHPLVCNAFIEISLALLFFLRYVVYLCQKSLNFVHALSCYKQKRKVVSFNLAPLCIFSDTTLLKN